LISTVKRNIISDIRRFIIDSSTFISDVLCFIIDSSAFISDVRCFIIDSNTFIIDVEALSSIPARLSAMLRLYHRFQHVYQRC
jgi:hypothetical protein